MASILFHIYEGNEARLPRIQEPYRVQAQPFLIGFVIILNHWIASIQIELLIGEAFFLALRLVLEALILLHGIRLFVVWTSTIHGRAYSHWVGIPQAVTALIVIRMFNAFIYAIPDLDRTTALFVVSFMIPNIFLIVVTFRRRRYRIWPRDIFFRLAGSNPDSGQWRMVTAIKTPSHSTSEDAQLERYSWKNSRDEELPSLESWPTGNWIRHGVGWLVEEYRNVSDTPLDHNPDEGPNQAFSPWNDVLAEELSGLE